MGIARASSAEPWNGYLKERTGLRPPPKRPRHLSRPCAGIHAPGLSSTCPIRHSEGAGCSRPQPQRCTKPGPENPTPKKRRSELKTYIQVCIVLIIPHEESMNPMSQKIAVMIALGTLALVVGLGELRPAQAQEAQEAYPSM